MVITTSAQERCLAAILRRVGSRFGLVLLLAAGALTGCGGPAAGGHGTRAQAGSSCDTAVASAPALRGVTTADLSVPGSPFGVVATADGRWSFVSLTSAVEVLSNRALAPAAGAWLSVPGARRANS